MLTFLGADPLQFIGEELATQLPGHGQMWQEQNGEQKYSGGTMPNSDG